ncbi:hypothetical protein U3A58_06115 [Algoriphagus sp. C2-6-M1]|uniref:hypothetical protein n=1 Tax=Algoriphagus persicinus TaxID=3108754 RepID=UPI002B3FC5F3|nr:hypothetical protein [Algoriphagus sp. C2-6-M1]MEB2779964.1 hypothetical protein [Algoriphagus sp. C2-6-M1]
MLPSTKAKARNTNKPENTQDSNKKTTEELIREAKVTKEDMQALGLKYENLSDDRGDDEQLIERKKAVDFTGNELDVPGSELDDEQERIGLEDEENNFYSNTDEEEKL